MQVILHGARKKVFAGGRWELLLPLTAALQSAITKALGCNWFKPDGWAEWIRIYRLDETMLLFELERQEHPIHTELDIATLPLGIVAGMELGCTPDPELNAGGCWGLQGEVLRLRHKEPGELSPLDDI